MNLSGGDGAEVIYSLRGTDKLPNLILSNLQKEGQNIRKAYTRRLPSNPSKDYYFIHRNTGVTEPIIVEYGFLDSTKDDASQLKNNWQNYAEAVVKSIAEYLNVPYNVSSSDNVYIVKSGDTLWSIAKKYGISVNELKELNNLNTNMLKVGMQLKLSNDNSSDTYTVKSGDTIFIGNNEYNGFKNISKKDVFEHLFICNFEFYNLMNVPIFYIIVFQQFRYYF